MTSLIDRDALIAEYDRVHVGEPGKARQLMEEAPTIDAVPVEFIKERMNNYAENKVYAASMILDVLLIAWERERKRHGQDNVADSA
jgi:hypothetical protein